MDPKPGSAPDLRAVHDLGERPESNDKGRLRPLNLFLSRSRRGRYRLLQFHRGNQAADEAAPGPMSAARQTGRLCVRQTAPQSGHEDQPEEPEHRSTEARLEFILSARSSVVNGSFRGPKERRSFKPKVAGSTPVGRIERARQAPVLLLLCLQLLGGGPGVRR